MEMGAGTLFSSFAVSAVLYSVGSVFLYTAFVRSAARLHALALDHVVKSRMQFFDSQPVGRILGRFSKDLDVADHDLPFYFEDWLVCILEVSCLYNLISCLFKWFLCRF